MSRASDREEWLAEFARQDPHDRGHYLVVCALRQSRGWGTSRFERCLSCRRPFQSQATTGYCATCALRSGIERARTKAAAAARIQEKLRRIQDGEKVSLAEDLRELSAG